MFFSDITNGLNWEILTKNLVLLKDGMGLRIKKFEIMVVHSKIWFLGWRGFRKTNLWGGNWVKRGACTVCRFEGGLGKKRVVLLLRGEGGVDTPMHNIICLSFTDISFTIGAICSLNFFIWFRFFGKCIVVCT